jgi:hypothetical protein
VRCGISPAPQLGPPAVRHERLPASLLSSGSGGTGYLEDLEIKSSVRTCRGCTVLLRDGRTGLPRGGLWR